MTDLKPLDPDYEARVRASFARQKLMSSIKAEMTEIAPGRVVIEMPFDENFTQQNGFVHAGVITAIVDSACGYAAYSLMPADSDVLSVEYKVNFLAPAKGDRFTARGQVVRSGRTITVCEGEVTAVTEKKETVIAVMLATMISLKKSPAG
jgi:uncharacterized protein (TIGR00369 family)